MFENNPDWAPSLQLGHSDVMVTDVARFQRQAQRKERARQQLHQQPPSPELPPVQELHQEELPPVQEEHQEEQVLSTRKLKMATGDGPAQIVT
ncbi:unnamed protein product [Merluccius merluccius]